MKKIILAASLLLGNVVQVVAGDLPSAPHMPMMMPQEYLSSMPHASPTSFRDKYHESLKRNHTKVLDQTALMKALEKISEDPNNRNNVILFYSQQSVPKSAKQAKLKKQKTSTIEHIWPQTRGLQKKHQWANMDLHHLRIIDPAINNSRGEFDFAEGGAKSTLCECKRSVHSDKKGTWEPPDAIKGDIARILFYMDVRYEGEDANTPDLELVDYVTDGRKPQLGEMCTLLVWHQNDPPNQLERIRNYKIEAIQGNRNPFIDNPKIATRLWAPFCGD